MPEFGQGGEDSAGWLQAIGAALITTVTTDVLGREQERQRAPWTPYSEQIFTYSIGFALTGMSAAFAATIGSDAAAVPSRKRFNISNIRDGRKVDRGEAARRESARALS